MAVNILHKFDNICLCKSWYFNFTYSSWCIAWKYKYIDIQSRQKGTTTTGQKCYKWSYNRFHFWSKSLFFPFLYIIYFSISSVCFRYNKKFINLFRFIFYIINEPEAVVKLMLFSGKYSHTACLTFWIVSLLVLHILASHWYHCIEEILRIHHDFPIRRKMVTRGMDLCSFAWGFRSEKLHKSIQRVTIFLFINTPWWILCFLCHKTMKC